MLNEIYNNQEKLMGIAYVFVVFTSIIKLSSAISSSSIGVIIGELFAMIIYIAIAIMWFLLIKIGNSIRKRKVDIEKVYKINQREDSNERNPLYGIAIKMKNDAEHVEWYEDYRPELIEAGYIAEKIRDERFKNILPRKPIYSRS